MQIIPNHLIFWPQLGCLQVPQAHVLHDCVGSLGLFPASLAILTLPHSQRMLHSSLQRVLYQRCELILSHDFCPDFYSCTQSHVRSLQTPSRACSHSNTLSPSETCFSFSIFCFVEWHHPSWHPSKEQRCSLPFKSSLMKFCHLDTFLISQALAPLAGLPLP